MPKPEPPRLIARGSRAKRRPAAMHDRRTVGTGVARARQREQVVVRDVYLQPDAPDPVLDERTVLAVVRRHVAAPCAVASIDESGGEARAYAISGPAGDLILKTQRPHRV